MKILHTADLHLGKNLYETSQSERQRKMLTDLHNILIEDNYAALIIAGDIYDRSVPPAEYVAIFDSFLSALHRDCPNTAVFIIPGNHDSAERLSFGSQLLKSSNIHIASGTGKLCTPIIIAQNGEKVQFFLMPFLHLGSFFDETGESLNLNSQSEMAQEAARRLKEAVDPSIPAVLAAHLFTLNGESSSSERAFLGTAEYVSPALFDFFTYTALGHLHKMQKVTDRMYYSGAPLTYAFDECSTEKVVLSIDIDCKTQGFPISVEKIPIKPLRKMTRLEGTFFDFFNTGKFDAYKNDFLEIKLIGDTLIQSPMSLLQQKFPYLLNLHQEAIAAELKDESENHILNKNIEDTEVIFENFMLFEEAIDEKPSAKKQELFKKICQEISQI